MNAFKNEQSTFMREPASGSRGGGEVTDWAAIDVRRAGEAIQFFGRNAGNIAPDEFVENEIADNEDLGGVEFGNELFKTS